MIWQQESGKALARRVTAGGGGTRLGNSADTSVCTVFKNSVLLTRKAWGRDATGDALALPTPAHVDRAERAERTRLAGAVPQGREKPGPELRPGRGMTSL